MTEFYFWVGVENPEKCLISVVIGALVSVKNYGLEQKANIQAALRCC